MKQNYFFEYVPNAYISLCVDKAQQMANNRFVYDFKAGDKKAAHLCAEWLVRYLTRQYSSILEDFVVVFAPCSTQWKYTKRFGYLAAILNAAGIKTANEHVHIFGERKPTHNGGSHVVNEDIYHVSVDGEYFKGKQAHVILMNQNFRLIKSVKLSEGGITETSVDIRILMREAVLSGATIMAFVHNHPSGNTQPSKADDVLTQQIAKACQVMRLFFMDHVIVTDGAFYSYHDKGRL